MERVVYGKNKEENIVNISVRDNTTFIFKEKDNKVSYSTLPYKHWVLASEPHKGFSKLKGDEHYKYMKEYDTVDQFNVIKDNMYKMGCWNVPNFSEAFMMKNGHTYFKGTKINEVSLLSFDIETTGLNPHASDAKVLLITNTFRNLKGTETRTFNESDYISQQDMINDWCKWVQDKDPSLLIGHNIIIFDIPYISAQMTKVGEELVLGRLCQPIEIEEKIRELRVDGSQTYSYQRINIFGREIMDTFFMAIKADIAKKYTSYALKSIIKQEGLEKPGRTHYDASKIKQNWNIPEERVKIIAYAEDDSEDPIKLYDLMIAPFFYLTPHIPKPFQFMVESATGSQINSLMVRSYLQDGWSVAKGDRIEPFAGAVSFGNVGIYENVFKVDVASLYPSIMRHYKIFPEGKDFNGNFLKALDYFTLERLKNKQLAKTTGDRHYKDLEQAQKVVINSAYGFMGANGLNYNFGKGAAAITRYGREIIMKAVDWAEGCGYVISNCDTDSISFAAGWDLSKEDRLKLLKELNALYPDAIKYEDDGYYKKVIILKAKNYILYDGEKIKLKGSSLRDQKKEPALKEMMGKMIECLVYGKPDDIVHLYNDYIKETKQVRDIRRWSSKKSVSKAILNCAIDPEARLNESKVYDAIKHTPVQEGDKVYLYPCILSQTIERKEYKNGNVKEKVIKETGLKLADEWKNDHDPDKLIQRVYNTVEILGGVLDMDKIIDYTKVKNKSLIDNIA